MTAFMPPSSVFSVTLPVNPSVTATSTVSLMMSRPSMLPMKLMPDASASSLNASLRSESPLPGSSPIDSSPTRGSAIWKRWRA